jgi:hypothetical protein
LARNGDAIDTIEEDCDGKESVLILGLFLRWRVRCSCVTEIVGSVDDALKAEIIEIAGDGEVGVVTFACMSGALGIVLGTLLFIATDVIGVPEPLAEGALGSVGFAYVAAGVDEVTDVATVVICGMITRSAVAALAAFLLVLEGVVLVICQRSLLSSVKFRRLRYSLESFSLTGVLQWPSF